VRQELARVEAEVALCRRCFGNEPRCPARLERPPGRARVLVLGERPPRATLEAEQRLGLSGTDATTRFLARLVKAAGIPRGEVILGAAMLCAPRDREVERLVPVPVRIRECAGHVRELVRAVQPRMIVPLGAAALRSLRAAFPEQAPLVRLRFPSAVGRTVVAGAVFFHPLYHPSGRARLARPEAEQLRDWKRVGALWEWIAGGETGPAPGSGVPAEPP
jgi:uracil-DNA glycosylase family 4